jgi:hypothetical protein
MPFKLKKLPNVNLYKVYGPSGALSKKGLTKTMAEKQKIAVQISEAKKSK